MVLTYPWNGAHTSYPARTALWRSLSYRLLTYCAHSNKGQSTVTSLGARYSLVQGQRQLKDQPCSDPWQCNLLWFAASINAVSCWKHCRVQLTRMPLNTASLLMPGCILGMWPMCVSLCVMTHPHHIVLFGENCHLLYFLSIRHVSSWTPLSGRGWSKPGTRISWAPWHCGGMGHIQLLFSLHLSHGKAHALHLALKKIKPSEEPQCCV